MEYSSNGFGVDMTTSKESNSMKFELASMGALGKMLLDSVENAYFEIDLLGLIRSWGKGAEKSYGYIPSEAIGKLNFNILINSTDPETSSFDDLTSQVNKNGYWKGKTRNTPKNQIQFDGETIVYPKKDDQELISAYVVITTKKFTKTNVLLRGHRSALYDSSLFKTSAEAMDFIESVLESSTEYSMIGKDLNGKILLWNEGARRLYGYEPDELLGKANSSILHVPEDVAKGLPEQIMATSLKEGKWEGVIERMRKDRTRFFARVVITPRLDAVGKSVGFLLISKDISDEIRLNKQIEATQLYTRSLIESNIDALITTDTVGIITDVNRQMELLTGGTRSTLIGSPFKNWFTDPNRAEEGIKLVLREGKATNYELVAQNVNGQTTKVSYNASIFKDSDGKLQGMFASARDITAQNKLEEKLRESEAYNRGLIEASVDGLITVDLKGMITDVNAKMCEMSGYSRDELIGSAFPNYFADPKLAMEGVTHTFEKGAVTDYVLPMLSRKGDSTLTVSFNASVFKDQAGIVRGIFASARDITEQSRLQTQLSDERTYNRGLIEASVDGLITVDSLLVITDVNATMCRMTGYSREKLVGSNFSDYFTDPKRAADGVRLTLNKGVVTNYELTLRGREGVESLVSFNAAVYKDQNQMIRGIFASARDIGDQRKLQDQLAEERTYNRGLIESSVDGLVTVDESLVITDVNETMCRMVGRQRIQLIGSLFTAYFTEHDGAVTNYVLTILSSDNRKLPVSFNAAVFKDTSGKVRGIFASARDITSQKKLELELQSSQFYTRSLIESNIDALMTTDILGILSDVNQQMVGLTGLSREQLIGTPFKGYFTDPERAEAGIKMALQEGRVTNYELTAVSGDGHQTQVSFNASTFKDAQNKLQGVFAAARVVTEQKKLESQLRESQAYNRGLIEASVDGLITVDPSGTISDVNDRMCQMTGYGRSELMGTQFSYYFTDPARATAGVKETFSKGVVTEYALTLVSHSRRMLQVSFNASIFKNEAGEVGGIFASARDITDRVKLEEQLREQQTYLRGLIESSVDGLVTVDQEGFITDVNDQMCRMSGSTREKMIGSQFKSFFTQPDQADIGVKRTLIDGFVKNYELTLLHSTGRKSTVSFNASTYRGPDGNVQGIFASARDISDQSRLQVQLVEQQAYNRSLIEASADALFAIAPDGVITDVNEAAARLTAFTRQHLVNSKFSDYFTEPAQATIGVEQTLKDGRVLGYELVLITRQGRRIVVSFNAGVFTNAAGVPLGILAAARDITGQKQMEQQLRDQQYYTRSLIESNIDALMTTDPLGNITDVNQQMEQLTGYTRDELIKTPFKKYFVDEARAEDGIRQVLREGKVTNYELTAKSKDGVKTVVSYNATIFNDQNGKLEGVFAAARDVTELKQFERTLQEKNAELEAASLSKDIFLSGMSHELRTPLNSIIGFTGILLMKLAGPLNVDQEKQLKTVQTSGRHLLSLINDLLDITKIESGKVELNTEEFSCKDMIEDVMTSLRPLAEEKHIELIVKPIDPDLVISSDKRKLSQIAINLIGNAIKFTEKGSVTIEMDRVIKNGVPLVELKIQDTGIGIRKEDFDKLFHAFTQLDTGSAKSHQGSGLGLHLSQKLAHLIGGNISFTSEFGKGSVFTVEL